MQVNIALLLEKRQGVFIRVEVFIRFEAGPRSAIGRPPDS